VIGTLHKPGTKNVKRLHIISGHHDSAPENTWLRFLGYGFFILLATFFIGYIIMLSISIIQLLGMINANANLVRTGTLGWIMMAFYHQKWDNPDILTIEPLLNVLKLTLEWIRNDENYEKILR
jgi:hypothetical protein